MARPETHTAATLVGKRRTLPVLKGHGDATWMRWRYPFTRRTPLLTQTTFNPVTLVAEKTILDKRPIYWLVALAAIAILPPLLGDNSVVAAATIFAIYAAINVVWMLTIGTAGIFSLATFAVVGVGAYGKRLPIGRLWLAVVGDDPRQPAVRPNIWDYHYYSGGSLGRLLLRFVNRRHQRALP